MPGVCVERHCPALSALMAAASPSQGLHKGSALPLEPVDCCTSLSLPAAEEQLALVTSSGRPFELIDVRVVGEDGSDVAKDSTQVRVQVTAVKSSAVGSRKRFCFRLSQCPPSGSLPPSLPLTLNAGGRGVGARPHRVRRLPRPALCHRRRLCRRRLVQVSGGFMGGGAAHAVPLCKPLSRCLKYLPTSAVCAGRATWRQPPPTATSQSSTARRTCCWLAGRTCTVSFLADIRPLHNGRASD